MKSKLLKLMMLILVFGASCTDLNENVLDESSVTGQTAKQQADGLIAPVYALLPNLHQHTQLFALSEISTDEAILPYRGGTDWGDNGIYLSLHRHETTSTDPNVRNTWNSIVQSISRAVIALYTLPTNLDPSAKIYLAEARAMRAFYNMLALDLFGVAFVKENPDDVSTIIRGQEAIDYISTELLAAEPGLETTTGPGRITKAGVWGLLARLNLNAAVYRDRYAASHTFRPEDMDKVIDYTSRIISSGSYALSPDYFAIFGDANNSNKELVFAVEQRYDLNGHNRLAYFSLSGDQFPLTAFPGANGTDGPGITSDFYRTWVNAYAPVDPAQADPRFYKKNINYPASGADTFYSAADYKIDRGILRGQQYGLIRVSGAFVKDAAGKFKVGKLYNVTRNRPTTPVDHTELCDFTTAGSDYSTGFRVEKYEFSAKSSSGRNAGEADIAIVRMGDVYLMRAEAKLRKGDAAGALTDVNAIRAARKYGTLQAPALAAIDLNTLLRERGF
ncbi:MAG TPA: RagB/SusD family nutrient uptake outer membrane protein, partial [Chitinophagaceae bacterium]|nr:RagB/SusD family nutrient uptake outer membrane protein [Chitinophagaceae bacterium]